MNLRIFAALLMLSSWTTFAGAIPYLHNANAQALESLPFTAGDPVARELSQLRAALWRDPRNLEAAVALANRYVGMLGEEGDWRYLGYAQAALAPWWELPAPPLAVQVLRANIRQFRHDFAGAVDDLGQVLEREPRNVRALALRAIIHIVQARYVQARIDCQALRRVGSPLVGFGCESMVDGMTGKAVPAYAALDAAVARSVDIAPHDMLWLRMRLADLAQRQGRDDLAESHLRQAMELGIPDTFLLAAYCDLLLDKKRYPEVVELLKDKAGSDTLLLRLTFAERALALPTAKGREATLASRYAASHMRGEVIHRQEEARFELEIRNNAKRALALAQENWKTQHDPRDARIFLEAALVTKDAAAAQPVLRWLRESGIEDAYLVDLGRQLRAMRR